MNQLPLAFKERFGTGKIALLLDSAPSHHGLDPGVKAHGTINNYSNAERQTMGYICVRRVVRVAMARNEKIDLARGLPSEMSPFPSSRELRAYARVLRH